MDRLRIIRAGIAVGLSWFGFMRASAQSIGVFADASASSCNITWKTAVNPQVRIYIHAVLGNLPGIATVQFRLDGLPPLPFTPPTEFPNAAIVLGNDVRNGIYMAFTTCQSAGPSGTVLIGTVNPIAFDPVGEHTLTINEAQREPNPSRVTLHQGPGRLLARAHSRYHDGILDALRRPQGC